MNEKVMTTQNNPATANNHATFIAKLKAGFEALSRSLSIKKVLCFVACVVLVFKFIFGWKVSEILNIIAPIIELSAFWFLEKGYKHEIASKWEIFKNDVFTFPERVPPTLLWVKSTPAQLIKDSGIEDIVNDPKKKEAYSKIDYNVYAPTLPTIQQLEVMVKDRDDAKKFSAYGYSFVFIGCGLWALSGVLSHCGW